MLLIQEKVIGYNYNLPNACIETFSY